MQQPSKLFHRSCKRKFYCIMLTKLLFWILYSTDVFITKFFSSPIFYPSGQFLATSYYFFYFHQLRHEIDCYGLDSIFHHPLGSEPSFKTGRVLPHIEYPKFWQLLRTSCIVYRVGGRLPLMVFLIQSSAIQTKNTFRTLSGIRNTDRLLKDAGTEWKL